MAALFSPLLRDGRLKSIKNEWSSTKALTPFNSRAAMEARYCGQIMNTHSRAAMIYRQVSQLTDRGAVELRPADKVNAPFNKSRLIVLKLIALSPRD